MSNLILAAKNFAGTFHRADEGQDAFEYLLVVGGISVAVVAAALAAPGLITPLVTAVGTALNAIVDTTPLT
ncbi:MAG: hypothetical protein ACM3S1_16935 [Hyphomicrobiales bacterium]